MKARCIIVAGPESGGTRLVTRMLIEAGFAGDAQAQGKREYQGWPQRWDVETPDPMETPRIVIRRSLPYHPFRQWPDMLALVERMEGAGYEVRMLRLHRDDDAVIASQIAHGYIHSTEDALIETVRVESAMCELEALRPEMKWRDTFYEAIVEDPQREYKAICRLAGVKAGEYPEYIFDGNEKYKEPTTQGANE